VPELRIRHQASFKASLGGWAQLPNHVSVWVPWGASAGAHLSTRVSCFVRRSVSTAVTQY
jgi:hypothetical protein